MTEFFKVSNGLASFLKNLVVLLILVGGAVGAGGDLRWVTHENFKLAASVQANALAQLEINQLDRRITFLQIKVQTNEATNSEVIILPELERQLRELRLAIE